MFEFFLYIKLISDISEIYFVDGGTEANNLAIYGVIDAYKKAHPEKKPHVITSSIEHASVYEYLKDTDCEVTFLAVNQQGRVNLKELRESQVNIEILIEANLVNDIEEFKKVLKENSELVAIFTSSIKTTQSKM